MCALALGGGEHSSLPRREPGVPLGGGARLVDLNLAELFLCRQFETFLRLSSVASKHAASPFEIFKAEAGSWKTTQSSFSLWQAGQGSRVGVNFRLACILQATHNQLMHAMNGNIPILRLARTDVHINATQSTRSPPLG